MEKVKFTERDGTLTAAIKGELDHFLAASVRTQIDAEITGRRPSRFVLDVSGVSFMDSSGLGLIMGRYALCKSTETDFILSGADNRINKILDMAGLLSVISTDEKQKGADKVEKQTV